MRCRAVSAARREEADGRGLTAGRHPTPSPASPGCFSHPRPPLPQETCVSRGAPRRSKRPGRSEFCRAQGFAGQNACMRCRAVSAARREEADGRALTAGRHPAPSPASPGCSSHPRPPLPQETFVSRGAPRRSKRPGRSEFCRAQGFAGQNACTRCRAVSAARREEADGRVLTAGRHPAPSPVSLGCSSHPRPPLRRSGTGHRPAGSG